MKFLTPLLAAILLIWALPASSSGGILKLRAYNMEPGRNGLLIVSNATPYSPVAFGFSKNGPGPTVTENFGTIGLTKPVISLPTIWADGWGRAINRQFVPAGFQGRSWWFQAYDVGTARLTNNLNVTFG